MSVSETMFLFKILKNKTSDYLFGIILQRRLSYITRNSDEVPLFKAKHNLLKNWFFPSTTMVWNSLDYDLRNSKSYTLFRSSTLKLTRSSPNSFYGLPEYDGYKASYQTPSRFESFTRTKIYTQFWRYIKPSL